MIGELRSLNLKLKIKIILCIFLIYIFSNFIGSIIEAINVVISKNSYINLIHVMFYTNLIFLILFIILFKIIKIKIFRYSLKNISKKELKVLVKIALLTILFSIILSNFVSYFNLMPENQNIIENIAKNTNTLILFLSLVIFAPISEELIFRYTIFGFSKNKVIGSVVSSVLFSLAHVLYDFNISSFFIYFSMGLLLSYIYIKTKSVEESIFAHFINNLISFIQLIF